MCLQIKSKRACSPIHTELGSGLFDIRFLASCHLKRTLLIMLSLLYPWHMGNLTVICGYFNNISNYGLRFLASNSPRQPKAVSKLSTFRTVPEAEPVSGMVNILALTTVSSTVRPSAGNSPEKAMSGSSL